MRSISVWGRGATPSTRVREWSDPVSGRMKETTDESGTKVTQHAKGDRQDVHIQAQPVTAKALATQLKG